MSSNKDAEEGGNGDFQSSSILLRANKEVNAIISSCFDVYRLSESGTQKIAIFAQGSISTSSTADIILKYVV